MGKEEMRKMVGMIGAVVGGVVVGGAMLLWVLDLAWKRRWLGVGDVCSFVDWYRYWRYLGVESSFLSGFCGETDATEYIILLDYTHILDSFLTRIKSIRAAGTCMCLYVHY